MSVTERPPELSSSSFSNAPYWLIVGGAAEADSSRRSRSGQTRSLEVFSLDLADCRVLPVFGAEESAAEFLRAWFTSSATNEAEGALRLRGTGVGELISLLSGSAFSAGPCADVERVALDPPLELIAGTTHGTTEGHAGGMVGMSRRCFLERLMGRGRPWFESAE